MEHQILVPDYYEKFACKGSDCHYNCCQDWEISFSKADYLKIRNAKKSPEMEAAIKAGVKRYRGDNSDTRYASFFDATTGLCAMQDSAGLCRLQSECGYQTLPKICQDFPRAQLLWIAPERSCTTGCERVVELLMESTEPLSFHYRRAERGELPPNGEAAAAATIAKRPIYQYYSEIQALCIDILQNRAYSLDDRMILLGIALKSLHELETAGKTEEFPQWLQEKQLLAVGDGWKESVAELEGNSPLCMANNVQILLRFDVPAGSKFAQLQAAVLQAFETSRVLEEGNGRVTCGISAYQTAVARFATMGYGEAMENILVNAVFHETFPFGKKEIWGSYLSLCYFYSLLKFVAAGSMTPEKGKDDFVELVTLVSRKTLHVSYSQVVEEFIANNSDTLAHMVVLLRG